MELDGKVAIVTGGGGPGCGRAIAERLAQAGAAVAVADIDEDCGRQTVERIGSQAFFIRADMRKAAEIDALFGSVQRRCGGVDVLVNNASAPFRPGQPLEHWQEIIETDLIGPMHATRRAIDLMRLRRGGAIIHMSSTSALAHGRRNPGGSPAYDVAKAGVLRLTTMLRALGPQDNIRVNCLLPDWVATPEVRAYWDTLTPQQRSADGIPARLQTPEQIAEAVLRLITDASLSGRALVWWSDDEARLIPYGDPGYAALEDA
jgi:NAD(P)-dependent dehydrogenase (short-subunit alcohol dehydrogenase family)